MRDTLNDFWADFQLAMNPSIGGEGAGEAIQGRNNRNCFSLKWVFPLKIVQSFSKKPFLQSHITNI